MYFFILKPTILFLNFLIQNATKYENEKQSKIQYSIFRKTSVKFNLIFIFKYILCYKQRILFINILLAYAFTFRNF
mgnify:CR=1 FL=1